MNSNQQQNLILRKSTKIFTGNDALTYQKVSLKRLVEIAETTYGPKGMEKLILDSDNVIWVTKDGLTIIDKITFDNPSVLTIIQAAKAVNKEVGDGTLSTILLAGNIINEFTPYIKYRKIHPNILVDGLQKATQEILHYAEQISIDIDINDQQLLSNVIKTSISSLSGKEQDFLSNLILEAIQKVLEHKQEKFFLHDLSIDIRSQKGADLFASQLIQGMAYLRERGHPMMRKSASNAKVLCLKDELKFHQRAFKLKDHYLPLDKVGQREAYKKKEDDILYESLNNILKLGVNVIAVEKGINKKSMQYLVNNHIFAFRRVVIEDLEKIAYATGSSIVSDLYEVTANDLGYAKKIEEIKIQDKEWIFIKGDEKNKTVTILLRGKTEQETREYEKIVHKAIKTIKNVLSLPKVVYGAGTFELLISRYLRNWARTLPSREQLAVLGYSRAFEGLPTTLIKNAGYDPIDKLTKLYNEYSKENVAATMNIDTGTIIDSAHNTIIDPLLTKKHIINTATETATTILRIDKVIKEKVLKGQEFYDKQKEEYLDPERIEKIHKDYGVDSKST